MTYAIDCFIKSLLLLAISSTLSTGATENGTDSLKSIIRESEMSSAEDLIQTSTSTTIDLSPEFSTIDSTIPRADADDSTAVMMDDSTELLMDDSTELPTDDSTASPTDDPTASPTVDSINLLTVVSSTPSTLDSTTFSSTASAPAPDLIPITSTTPTSNSDTQPPTTVSSVDSSEVKCDDSTYRIKFMRDSTDCNKYFFSCLPFNSSLNSSNAETKPISVKCNESLLFDQIELKCLPTPEVDCTEFKCPKPDILIADSKNPHNFIKCRDSIATRRQCEPLGTVFDNETETCVKPPPDPEPFKISLLKMLMRFMKSTEHFMTPWIKLMKINGTSLPNRTEDKTNISDVTDDVGRILIKNVTEIETTGDEFNDNGDGIVPVYEDKEVQVFTNDTNLIVLYYVVIVGTALLVVGFYLLVAATLAKIFFKEADNKDDEDLDGEFYRYNQNDKYLMTRL